MNRRTDHWPSDDVFEGFVRGEIVRREDVFENHEGDFLPRMRESIPGQYDRTHGVDIFAVDEWGDLWIIEVSRGSPRGAATFKGGGRGVKYADGNVQMSLEWRTQATYRFLDLMPDSTAKVRDLLRLPDDEPDPMVRMRFLSRLRNHRKAVVVPAGTHFDTIGTDVDFGTEVYTRRLAGFG